MENTGRRLWKCFLRGSNRLYQNSICVRRAPAAFFFFFFPHFLLKIQSIKSKAGSGQQQTVQPPSNPEKFYCGISARGGGGVSGQDLAAGAGSRGPVGQSWPVTH